MDFKKLALAGFVISCALILSACNLYKTQSTETQPAVSQEGTDVSTQEAQESVTITITDSGFEPASAKVKSGVIINWVNNSSKKVQIGSDNHPTHTLNKELTEGGFVTELAVGESKTTTVTKAGTWGFHDHINPSMKGTVVVK